MTTLDPAPTTRDLLRACMADAETIRQGVDHFLAALNNNVCPQCEGPLEVRRGDVACMRCEWWEAVG